MNRSQLNIMGGHMRATSISRTLIATAVLTLSACASNNSAGVNDPIEPVNRATHSVNKALDTVALRPGSQVYGTLLSREIRTSVNNLGDNLGTPTVILNNVLQFRLEDAVLNTTRLLINSTLGLGGLLDPATEMGLPARPTDFGETLHIWGFGEGAYVELPVLGPSTARDAVGELVDFALNPVARWLPAEQAWLVSGTFVAETLDARYTFGSTVDSVLYESADSYAQSRLFFLENRRFQLGEEAGQDDELFDIYEDAFE